ncbi:hypothetical protein LXA43DRAFT_1096421 [Ganoderma leucocontextum]|nr:hypothetical protein LXA43DRAFT_1096421 [Ganoderma leucocontextum]
MPGIKLPSPDHPLLDFDFAAHHPPTILFLRRLLAPTVICHPLPPAVSSFNHSPSFHSGVDHCETLALVVVLHSFCSASLVLTIVEQPRLHVSTSLPPAVVGLGLLIIQEAWDLRLRLKKHGRAEEAGALFDQVIFCTNVTYADGNFKGDLTMKALSDNELLHLKIHHELADAWSASLPSYLKDSIHVLPSTERAVNIIRKLEVFGEKPIVLVVGSLRGVIEVSSLSDVAL